MLAQRLVCCCKNQTKGLFPRRLMYPGNTALFVYNMALYFAYGLVTGGKYVSSMGN
jgi:hypothetical protein